MTDTTNGVHAVASTSIAAEIAKSRRELLDLSLRNSLLNFRTSNRRGVEVVDESSSETFRVLVEDERVMYFRPVPTAEGTGRLDSDRVAATVGISLPGPAESVPDSEDTDVRRTKIRLQTELGRDQLNLRLRETFRQARLSIEEQGVNILYLALGMLRWYESEDSDTERRAPLLLIPVELTRSNVRANYKLTWTKDDIEPNLSLESKLWQDFNVAIPEMPSEEDLDVGAYLRKVERAVAQQPRWTVGYNEIHLNFFSFSKLLIYKDLDPEKWPEDKQPADHEVVGKLYDKEGFNERLPDNGVDSDAGGSNRLDQADLRPVVDADSSQTRAVLNVMAGQNLVIQGPPGTGKSQTITNLIGEALARGKTVLFVAEKMAALEVVKRRLDSVHLGDACLELHSHKTNKRAVLDELRRTRSLGRPKVEGRAENHVLLESDRRRLDEYSRAVNTQVAQSELTPHELIGHLAKLKADGLVVTGRGLTLPESASWTADDFRRRRALVSEMQEQVKKIGIPRRHPWWGCGLRHFHPSDEHEVRDHVEDVSAAIRRLQRDWRTLSVVLRRDVAFGELERDGLQRTIRTARRAAEAPVLLGADHRHPGWVTEATRITRVATDARRYGEIRERHGTVLIPEAWDQDVLAARQALREYGQKWWRFLIRPFRDARRQVRGLCLATPPAALDKQIELLDGILVASRLRHAIAESRDFVADFFPTVTLGDRADAHRDLAEAVTWLVGLHRDQSRGKIDSHIHALLDDPPERSDLEASAEACASDLKTLDAALRKMNRAVKMRSDRFEPCETLEERKYVDLDAWLRDARDAVAKAHDVVRFNQLEEEASKQGIVEVAEAASVLEDAAQQLTAHFEHGCYTAWLEVALRKRTALAEFDGVTHAAIVERFGQLDEEQFSHNRALVAERHWQQLPRGSGGGQLAVLSREFEKKRRHLPVRRLMKDAGRAIQRMKPVFMMSPLSIAKYIPPTSVEFDLVVFDEASQVRPVEALGAIIRGKQAVVVGDSKQLPPTSFFDRLADDDEDEASQTADLESILGMFCAQGAPERMLKWHYRSLHESLITVSNHEFYENRLVTFPSPDADKKDVGLVFRHIPEAHYERRGINTAEAKTVAQAVMEHARATPELTLGVAAFSTVQARRIEDEIDSLRRLHPPCEEFFAGHPEEPFFVKNLENVQGDERDVILISIGYGTINGSFLPMNFGPLNKEGGERRLNVLITRARRRCVVYSNFVGGDLDLQRSKARGVEALKTFLEYAKTGNIDIPRVTGREADSPFEEAVATELRAKGFEVEHQVGTAGFFIDLAVRDPSRRGRFLLGIECDGAAYHSARSARDRDRLRQQVLEGLGWKIHRIWSTDWFRDPDRELGKVEEAIRGAQADALTSARNPLPTREPERPLERAAEQESKIPSPTHPYTMAKLHLPADSTRKPLHRWSRPLIGRLIADVVKVESPVHFDEVVTRIRVAAGVGRSGTRIRKQMRWSARLGVNKRLYREDARGFLWRLGHNAADVKVRRRDGNIPLSLQRADMIPPEEVGAALVEAVRASYGIAADDAVREAVRLFGFKRTGRKVARSFRHVLDDLVDNGRLAREGELLRLP